MAAIRAPGVSAISRGAQAGPTSQPFTVSHQTLEYRTQSGPWLLEITDDVRTVVRASGLRWGQVTVFSNHTTAAIRLQENEPLLLEDLKEMLERVAPRDHYYRHNDFNIRTVNMHPDEPKNGHSHCQQLLLSSSETIPLANGDLQMGEFQSIFLVELDGARKRRVTVSIMGTSAE